MDVNGKINAKLSIQSLRFRGENGGGFQCDFFQKLFLLERVSSRIPLPQDIIDRHQFSAAGKVSDKLIGRRYAGDGGSDAPIIVAGAMTKQAKIDRAAVEGAKLKPLLDDHRRSDLLPQSGS